MVQPLRQDVFGIGLLRWQRFDSVRFYLTLKNRIILFKYRCENYALQVTGQRFQKLATFFLFLRLKLIQAVNQDNRISIEPDTLYIVVSFSLTRKGYFLYFNILKLCFINSTAGDISFCI